MIVEKAVNMADMMDIPVLALVENMSYLKCPDCGKEIKIFGESNIEKIAKKHNVSLVAKIPVDPKIASLVDAGKVEDVDIDNLNGILESIIVK